jgi:hypothetical protein
MNGDSLRLKLERIHESLATAEGLDDSTVEAMKTVAADIQRIIDAPDESDMTDELTTIRQRVHDMVDEFETKHPHITDVLSQITDLLASIGI